MSKPQNFQKSVLLKTNGMILFELFPLFKCPGRAHMGPYGPIWAHMGPYGPLWAHMGPYGSSWTGLGRSGHVRFPTFGRILHVLGSKFSF